MISHVESVLKEETDAKASFNEVVEKLSAITESENEAESETELDEDEDLESFMNEFDQDGNRIFQKWQQYDGFTMVLGGLYSHLPIVGWGLPSL